MGEDKTRICVLFDFYGELLSPSVKDAVDLYYNDDLSLSEIAENTGISRQGVRDSLVRGAEMLYHYENILHLYEKYRNNEKTVKQLKDAVSSVPDEKREELLKLLSQLSI